MTTFDASKMVGADWRYVSEQAVKDTEAAADEIIGIIPTPFAHAFIILPLLPIEKTESGLYLGNTSEKHQSVTASIGKVLAVGEDAWRGPKWDHMSVLPAVGDWIHYPKHAGISFIYGGYKLKVMTEENILSTVPDPTKFGQTI